MACETIRDAEGHVTAILCGRSRRQTCRFCHNGYVTKLCDFPVAKGKTCDAGMCEACATNVAHEVDYCPNHKHQQPPQRNLFGE
jgi:predicted amidophosphoribosyltransferase